MELKADHRSIPELDTPARSWAMSLAFVLSVAVHAAALAGVAWVRFSDAPMQVVVVSLAEFDATILPGPVNPAPAPVPEPTESTEPEKPNIQERQPEPRHVTAVPRLAPKPPPAEVEPVSRTSPEKGMSSDRITQPRFDGADLANAPPRYPFSARRRGQEGKVVLRVMVAANGRSAHVRVSQSSGHRVLDKAATEAVEGWRFEAGTDAFGRAIAGEVEVPIIFRLTDS